MVYVERPDSAEGGGCKSTNHVNLVLFVLGEAPPVAGYCARIMGMFVGTISMGEAWSGSISAKTIMVVGGMKISPWPLRWSS